MTPLLLLRPSPGEGSRLVVLVLVLVLILPHVPPPALTAGSDPHDEREEIRRLRGSGARGTHEVVVEEALRRPLTSPPRVRHGLFFCPPPQVRADLETITALREQAREFERTVSGLEGRVAKVRSSLSLLLKAVLLAVPRLCGGVVCVCVRVGFDVFSRGRCINHVQDDLELASLRAHASHVEKELDDARAALEEQSACVQEDVGVYRHTINELHTQIAALHQGSADATALSAASLDRMAQLEGDAILMQVRVPRLYRPYLGTCLGTYLGPT